MMLPINGPSVVLLVLASFCIDTSDGLRINIPVQYLSVAENTPLNTVLLNLTLSGGNNARVECAHDQTSALVRLKPNGGASYAVLVNGQLDREVASSSKLNFRASDSDGNSVTASVTMYLSDVNDNSPAFQHIPYFWELYENPGDEQTACTPNCSTFSVSAKDPDRGNNATVRYSMESEERKTEYSETFRINNTSGLVTQVKTVNYEHNSYYQFVIYAKDLGSPQMTSNTSLIIQIKDVQDKAPFYTGIPYRATIDENLSVGSAVITVNAQDGDPGVSNKVNYAIETGPCTNLFVIDAKTGNIKTNQKIDRDTGAVKNVSGVCTLTVVAQEIPGNGNETQYGNTTATTDVTVMIADVDDNVPTFNADVYNASVQENAPLNIPITIDPRSIIAYDNDTGINARFTLTIKYADGSDCTDFDPWPNTVEGEQTIMIRVRNPAILDYEQRHNFSLHLNATEVQNASYECTSTIFLALIDVNDNNPKFQNTSYYIELEENISNFTSIGNITATDRDSDKNLTYTLSGGGERFFVDHMTGEIRTRCSDCNTMFDRETQDVFYLTYVVTDSGGRSDSVPLEVHLLDVNDNAPLFDRNYSASIRENDDTYINTSIVQFQARDIDLAGSKNSLISYSIRNVTQPALAKNFTLNNTTGELFLTDPMNYEALNGSEVTITVEATDAGDQQLSSTAHVVIDIQDENDNTPEFVDGPFEGFIAEDQTSNTSYRASVGSVNAIDKDGTQPNNQFNYFITNGADEKFSINSTSGEVSVQLNAKLDRETTPNYTLTIMIIDRGASPKSATTEMTVYVKDVNDEKPSFIRKEFAARVFETNTTGKQVVKCNASDPDLDSSLLYTITNVTAVDEDGKTVDANTVKDYFIINATTGNVSVNGSVDREIAKIVTLYIMVTDENASTRPQNDTATVRITILDVNDNDPQFVNTSLTLNVSENSQIPAILTTITATDKDENRTMSYNITRVYKTNTSVNPFDIDDDGVLRLTETIDREVDDVINVTIQATDSGVPSRSAEVNVTVNVVDFNDNAPQFNLTSFPNPCNVLENTTTDTILFNMSATDNDVGPNANITFSIDSGGHGSFTIDSGNGYVRIRNSLDRESIERYVLYITAKDNPLKISEQKSTSTTVTILVEDLNDNPPVFSKADYFIAKREDIEINETLLTVFATDNDLKDTPNSNITYAIDSVNSSEPFFRINPQTGDIIVNMSLRDQVNKYELNVSASDHGTPSLTGVATVVIKVDDVNLHPPVVTDVPINNTIKIYECIRRNTVIYPLTFTDEDRGRNAEAYFDISTVDKATSQLIANTFNISEDGKLRTRVELDVNKISSYTFQVQAIDRGDPVLKSDKVTVTVEVIDVNDHVPYFNQSRVNYTVIENQNDTNIGQVKAYDLDKDAIKCYTITGDNPKGEFHLGLQDGILTNTDMLDFETTSSYTFTIKVHDCSLQLNVSEACNNVTTSQTVNDTLTVQINVQDVNDNPPRFKNRQMFTGMIRRTEINTPLKVNLMSYNYVMDNDSAANGINAWTFFNDGPILASPGLAIDTASGNEMCEDGTKHIFCIFKNGTIMNGKYFKEDASGYFIVPVRVNDTAGSDTANITVYLIGDSQILVMTILDSKENVAKRRKDLLDSFSGVVGATLVYDKLEDHKTPSGQVVSAQSDLHFHVVDPKTNNVMSGSEARRLLDTFSSQLTSTMKQYHVSTVDQSVQMVSETDKSSKTAFILMAVVAVLVISNGIFIYVFLSVRNRYKRKLLAATINTTQDKGMEMQTTSLAIPGSNKYMAQSNPLLNADIDEHPHAEYDDISLHSSNSLDANEVGERIPAEQSRYDRLEEKEVTLDMYTEDAFTASMEGESPLDAAIRLHDESRELENLSMDEEDDEGYPGQFINYAYEEQLETSEI